MQSHAYMRRYVVCVKPRASQGRHSFVNNAISETPPHRFSLQWASSTSTLRFILTHVTARIQTTTFRCCTILFDVHVSALCTISSCSALYLYLFLLFMCRYSYSCT